MPARTWTLEDRLKSLPTIFDQVQNTTANHSKNYVALYKVHQEAAKVTESVNNGEGIRLTGERAFEDKVIDIINRVLVVKKGEAVADRVVKFIGGYIKFGSDKGK
jgi:condensin complex subunit 3